MTAQTTTGRPAVILLVDPINGRPTVGGILPVPAGRPVMEVLEDLFVVCNIGDPSADERARSYREDYGSRSLSTGDLIRLDGTTWRVAAIGFEPL